MDKDVERLVAQLDMAARRYGLIPVPVDFHQEYVLIAGYFPAQEILDLVARQGSAFLSIQAGLQDDASDPTWILRWVADGVAYEYRVGLGHGSGNQLEREHWVDSIEMLVAGNEAAQARQVAIEQAAEAAAAEAKVVAEEAHRKRLERKRALEQERIERIARWLEGQVEYRKAHKGSVGRMLLLHSGELTGKERREQPRPSSMINRILAEAKRRLLDHSRELYTKLGENVEALVPGLQAQKDFLDARTSQSTRQFMTEEYLAELTGGYVAPRVLVMALEKLARP